jgi:hypothetical protein
VCRWRDRSSPPRTATSPRTSPPGLARVWGGRAPSLGGPAAPQGRPLRRKGDRLLSLAGAVPLVLSLCLSALPPGPVRARDGAWEDSRLPVSRERRGGWPRAPGATKVPWASVLLFWTGTTTSVAGPLPRAAPSAGSPLFREWRGRSAPEVRPMTDPTSATHEPDAWPTRPVLFYALAFAIAWMAWLPLPYHQVEVPQLPIPFGIALFVGQTLEAFAPLLSLFAIQRTHQDHTLVKWS